MSIVIVVCCQVEVSATSRSLVQRGPTDYGVSLCVIYKPRERRSLGPLGGCCPKNKQTKIISDTNPSDTLRIISKNILMMKKLIGLELFTDGHL
jgi:hypothetical protein